MGIIGSATTLVQQTVRGSATPYLDVNDPRRSEPVPEHMNGFQLFGYFGRDLWRRSHFVNAVREVYRGPMGNLPRDIDVTAPIIGSILAFGGAGIGWAAAQRLKTPAIEVARSGAFDYLRSIGCRSAVIPLGQIEYSARMITVHRIEWLGWSGAFMLMALGIGLSPIWLHNWASQD